jgi:hypothetical protein
MRNDVSEISWGYQLDMILVGGFKHEFYFPFHIWDVILPIDFHIFQDGWNHQPG